MCSSSTSDGHDEEAGLAKALPTKSEEEGDGVQRARAYPKGRPVL